MTNAATIPQVNPVVAAAAAEADTARVNRHSFRTRLLFVAGGALLMFVATYILAWFTAYRLSAGYLQDAQASYQAGKYLDALVGYKEYDAASKRYVQHGGYLQVKRIWSNGYAQPIPSEAGQVPRKIDEIVSSHLTLDDAEQFVQENTGQSNPALGMIYLRLGELYEVAGRRSDAQDAYKVIADSFPDDPALTEKAKQHLAALGTPPKAAN